MENWTCEMIENLMNYIRVVLGGEKIFMFYLENDRIGYWTADGIAHCRDISTIYEEMLDRQKKI